MHPNAPLGSCCSRFCKQYCRKLSACQPAGPLCEARVFHCLGVHTCQRESQMRLVGSQQEATPGDRKFVLSTSHARQKSRNFVLPAGANDAAQCAGIAHMAQATHRPFDSFAAEAWSRGPLSICWCSHWLQAGKVVESVSYTGGCVALHSRQPGSRPQRSATPFRSAAACRPAPPCRLLRCQRGQSAGQPGGLDCVYVCTGAFVCENVCVTACIRVHVRANAVCARPHGRQPACAAHATAALVGGVLLEQRSRHLMRVHQLL